MLLFSCQKNNPQEKLLIEAQDSLIIGKPDIALNLLASIKSPEKMDKNSYMLYIATYVGAKKETKADISGDTLIFEVQSYFNDKGDSKNSALVNYYAGWVYYTNHKLPQSLESFMNSADAADKSKNYLLAAKSFNNIGYIYFEQNILDSAISNYKKALPYYDKLEDVGLRKMETYTNIGRSFEDYNKLDSAYFYFNKALDKATELNDHKYISISLQNLGVVCYGVGEYDKSIEYFQSALSMNVTNESDKQKIYIFLLNSRNKKNDLKSAKQDADLIISVLPEVTYNYTIKGMSSALADYLELTGDYKQALEYSKLEKGITEQINQERNAPALLAADKNFYLVKSERESQAFKSDILFILTLVASAFCILLVFFLFVWRNHKKDQAEMKFYEDKFNIMRQALYAHNDEYPKLEAEIRSMLKDD